MRDNQSTLDFPVTFRPHLCGQREEGFVVLSGGVLPVWLRDVSTAFRTVGLRSSGRSGRRMLEIERTLRASEVSELLRGEVVVIEIPRAPCGGRGEKIDCLPEGARRAMPAGVPGAAADPGADLLLGVPGSFPAPNA